MNFDDWFTQVKPQLCRRMGLGLFDQTEAESVLAASSDVAVPTDKVRQMLVRFRAAAEPVIFGVAARARVRGCPETDFLQATISQQITVVLAVMAERGVIRF